MITKKSTKSLDFSNGSSESRKPWKDVTKDEPCRHCGKDHWCYRFLDSPFLEVCKRNGLLEGWKKIDKHDNEGAYYLAPIDQQKQARPKQRRQWLYEDREGKPLVMVNRIDNGSGKKKIYQEHYQDGRWVTALGDIKREDIPVYHYKEVGLARIVGGSVFIVEGESCVDSLRSLNLFVTTNIGGSGKWTDGDSKDVEGLQLILSPDRDKPGVKHFLDLYKRHPDAKVLLPYRDSPFWDNLPNDGGLDIADEIEEYHLSKDDILNRIMDITPEFIQRLERQINAVQSSGASTDVDSIDALDNPSRKAKNTPVRLGQSLAEDFRADWAYHEEQQTWRCFDGQIWNKTTSRAFRSLVYQQLKPIGLDSRVQVNGAVETLEDELIIPEWKSLDPKRYIPFDNLIYDCHKRTLEEYKPGFRLTNKLPYPYQQIDVEGSLMDAFKEECPNIYAYMNRAMDRDSARIKLLLAIINAAIKWRFFEFQKFVTLTGKSGAGKGTFIRLLTKIVGDENHQATKLANLSKDASVAAIIDKQLVTCPDERRKTGIDDLLALTGGDKVGYRDLYKSAASSHFLGLIVIGCNNPIFIGDTTGIDRRQVLVHFNTAIPRGEQNSKSEELFDSEITSLVSLVLTMADSEVETIIKGEGDATIPIFKLYEWKDRTQNDTLAAFVDEWIIREEGKELEVYIGDGNSARQGYLETLFGAYREYAKYSGGDAKKLQNFTEDFVKITSDVLGWNVKKGKRNSKGNRIVGEVRLRRPTTDKGEEFDRDIPTLTEQLEQNAEIEKSFGVLPTLPTQSLPGKDCEPITRVYIEPTF